MTEDITPYAKTWITGGAVEWAGRAAKTVAELDERHMRDYNIARTTLFGWMLRDLPREAQILEVGAAEGLQLQCLEGLGFTNLFACDISEDVLAACPYPSRVGDLRDLPYADQSFDLVFTSGTFMHVPFEDKMRAGSELIRVSRRYVWGFEYQTWTGTKQMYTEVPPAYLLPWERLWREICPGGIILRSDTWRGPTGKSTYVYLFDQNPNQKDIL